MIDPPKGALHKPIPASKIVFAGDSAGGGLCLNVLTIIRDMGLPMPSGAVLISPWVDLTHSFPSVIQNVDTDIIPPHGFMAKPSTLWPVKPLADRVVPTTTNAPPQPGHPDTLKPDEERLNQQEEAREHGISEDAISPEYVQTQGEMQEDFKAQEEDERKSDAGPHPSQSDVRWEMGDWDDIFAWEPKAPKVLMNDPQSTPLELRSQIQLYATNEYVPECFLDRVSSISRQITHPATSPILATLGNLCPLYIVAGQAESLRDEIIYLAHKCAAPEQYRPRTGISKGSKRQQENAEKYTKPTKVSDSSLRMRKS